MKVRTAAIVALLVLAGFAHAQEKWPEGFTRRWVGRDYWANRLQDWQVSNGRLECLVDKPAMPVRTVFVLTRWIEPGPGEATLVVETGTLSDRNSEGWSGFLVGIGQGRLDYRAAALVHHLSGEGGGIMAVFQTDGKCTFREHTSEKWPAAFAPMPCHQDQHMPAYRRTPDELIRLILQIRPTPGRTGRFDLSLAARDARTHRLISEAVLKAVEERQILGGIALVSHPARGARKGARFWFKNLEISGSKVSKHPERAWGPVAGTLFSLNGNILRLNAQFMPLGPTTLDAPVEYTAARLDYRPADAPNATWTKGPVSKIEPPSQTALFRIEGWDCTRDFEYRVVPIRPDGSPAPESLCYHGRIPRDPAHKDTLVIAAFTGCYFIGRACDRPDFLRKFEGRYGRYTPEMMWLPDTKMLSAVRYHKPDLLVFTGDQLYQGCPTRAERPPCPADDYLYKWLYWIASFRELTARIPTIVLVDDHDVYQGNIWGWSGRKNTTGSNRDGGYIYSPKFVNMVQRCQTAHDPDPYDPTPILQGITVYYTAFKYGGVSFAVLEDRKFKTPPAVPPEKGELLGARQEKFLADWARDWEGVVAKVAITQTVFASVSTDANGNINADQDTNGFPKPARDRAVRLLRDAGAIVISGDQHHSTVTVQYLEDFSDGVVQFAVPAVASTFQRWWDPAQPGQQRQPGAPAYTGNFIDPFGNRFRVLAAVGPAIPRKKARRPIIRDPKLTRNGYGIIRVDKKSRQFILEAWPRHADPARDRPYPGWPVRVPFPKGRYGPQG